MFKLTIFVEQIDTENKMTRLSWELVLFGKKVIDGMSWLKIHEQVKCEDTYFTTYNRKPYETT